MREACVQGPAPHKPGDLVALPTLAPMSGSSETPVTPASEDPVPSSALLAHTHTHIHT